jgi:hypothetical protein
MTARAGALAAGAALLLVLQLAGCATAVKVAEPVDCDASADLLARRCAAPQDVPDGATYEQVLQAGGNDRDALRVCARHAQLLADVVRACNAAIDRHRSAIRGINQQLSGKP